MSSNYPIIGSIASWNKITDSSSNWPITPMWMILVRLSPLCLTSWSPNSKFIWDKSLGVSGLEASWALVCTAQCSSPLPQERHWIFSASDANPDSPDVWVPLNSCIWGLHRMLSISEEAVLQTHPSSTLNLSQITFRKGVFVWIAKRSKIEKEFRKESFVSNICSSTEHTQLSHCWWLDPHFQTDKV